MAKILNNTDMFEFIKSIFSCDFSFRCSNFANKDDLSNISFNNFSSTSFVAEVLQKRENI